MEDEDAAKDNTVVPNLAEKKNPGTANEEEQVREGPYITKFSNFAEKGRAEKNEMNG